MIAGLSAVVIPWDSSRSLEEPRRLCGDSGGVPNPFSLSLSFSYTRCVYLGGMSSVSPVRGAPSCGCSKDCLAVVVVGARNVEGTARMDEVRDCILLCLFLAGVPRDLLRFKLVSV